MSKHVGAAPRSGLWVGAVLLRLVVVAGLAVDVYVHLHLAASYDANTAAISEGTLFRVEAGVAGLAAVLVLLTRTQSDWWWRCSSPPGVSALSCSTNTSTWVRWGRCRTCTNPSATRRRPTA